MSTPSTYNINCFKKHYTLFCIQAFGESEGQQKAMFLLRALQKQPDFFGEEVTEVILLRLYDFISFALSASARNTAQTLIMLTMANRQEQIAREERLSQYLLT